MIWVSFLNCTRNERILKNIYYSVMQSDIWSSFCGDVVFDSVNIAYRDEDSILDQPFPAEMGFEFRFFKIQP